MSTGSGAITRRRCAIVVVGAGLVGVVACSSTGSTGVGVIKNTRMGQTLILRGTFGEAAVTIVSVTDPAVPSESTPPAESGDHYISVRERVSAPTGHLHEEIGLETSVDTATLRDLNRGSPSDAINGCAPLPEEAILASSKQLVDGCLAIQVPDHDRVEDIRMQMYYGMQGDWSVP